MTVSDEAKDILVKEGYDPAYGARPLRRTIQRLIEDPLAEALLSGQYQAGDNIKVEVEEGNVKLD